MAKRILNIKDSKKAIEYANMFISRVPKESKRILVYGIADIRALEEILIAFPDKEFTIVEQVNIVNLLKKIYTSDKYHFVEAEYDSADLALFNENGEIRRMPRFDCAIMNPPYDGNLHLKILSEVLKHVDRVVNISPVRNYMTIRNLWDKRAIMQYNSTPGRKNLVELVEIPFEESNRLFTVVRMTMQFGLQVYDNTVEAVDYPPETHVILNGHARLIRKIMEKCVANTVKNHTNGEYVLPHARYIGATDSFLNSSYESQLSSKGDKRIGFRTEEDRHNFYTFWSGKYGHVLISLWKDTNDVYQKYIPYFWAERGKEKEAMMDYFGLSEDEFEELMTIRG